MKLWLVQERKKKNRSKWWDVEQIGKKGNNEKEMETQLAKDPEDRTVEKNGAT